MTYYQNLLESIETTDEDRLVALLPTGQENRAERQQLVIQLYGEFTPNTDRKFRALVARMQNSGCLILSDSSEGGFWIAASLDEVKTFVATEIDSRIKKLGEKKASLLDHARRHFGGQTSLADPAIGGFWY